MQTINFQPDQLVTELSEFDHQLLNGRHSTKIDRTAEAKPIGNTSLYRASALGTHLGLKNLFLKLETENHSGTQKDRVAHAHVNDALAKEKTSITTATCGNYGVSLTYWATAVGMDVYIYIPSDYHPAPEHMAIMNELGAKITRTPGFYEDSVKYSINFAVNSGCYNANPGGENTEFQLQAYSKIAVEIAQELQTAPDFVAVPVSNGTTFAGIYSGFCSLHKTVGISKLPRMLAGSILNCNPIIESWSSRKGQYYPLVESECTSFIETPINEPLINIDSLDGAQAYAAIIESNGAAYGFTDSQMLEMSALVHRLENKTILPASTAGLLTLDQLRQDGTILESDLVVAIITGKGHTESTNSYKIKNSTKIQTYSLFTESSDVLTLRT